MIFSEKEFLCVRIMIGPPVKLDEEARLPVIYEPDIAARPCNKTLFLLTEDQISDQLFAVRGAAEYLEARGAKVCYTDVIAAYRDLAEFLKTASAQLDKLNLVETTPIDVGIFAQNVAQQLERVVLEIDYLPDRYKCGNTSVDAPSHREIPVRANYKRVRPEHLSAVLAQVSAPAVYI